MDVPAIGFVRCLPQDQAGVGFEGDFALLVTSSEGSVWSSTLITRVMLRIQ